MLSARIRSGRPGKTPSSTTHEFGPKPSEGPAICASCRAVWRKGTWSVDPAVRREVCRWRTPTTVTCPACRRAQEGIPTGILYLTGPFLARNRAEILNLLRNGVRAAAAKNPLERIIRVQHDSHQLVVETTSKLARRLGRAVSRACGGALEIRFSHEDKLVRVYWRRDAAEPPA